MLKSIHIKNFALIENLDLDFIEGLNIITGETGAGKSIIVDALMLLLGERASLDFIREGESKAVIEGFFEISKNHPVYNILKNNDYDCEENSIIIRREILLKGSSRSFLNDSPVQFSLLKEIGELLVDFHGQHDHQQLLNPDNHINILDIIADNKILKNEYTALYNRQLSVIKRYNDLLNKKTSQLEKYDSFQFELSEINKIAPLPDEETVLESELFIKENSEQLFNLVTELYSYLYEGETSVYDKLISSKKIIEKISKIDDSFDVYDEELNSTLMTIKEMSNFAGEYKNKIEIEPERLDEIRERLFQLRGLRKKYGTYELIFERRDFLESEINLIENFDDQISNIYKEIYNNKIELGNIAEKLSEKRKLIAKTMELSIVDNLKELGIENSQFRVVFNNEILEKESNNSVIVNNINYKAFSDGIDKVQFFISTNKGETPKSLSEIASGGEISRVMLSIKSLIAESDELPMLVFDEIDSGISGRIAQKVGIAMKKLAKNHQVVSITHLAQIAALGDNNINVQKCESNGRTFINAKTLDYDEKVIEVAKMISGEELTEASKNSARDLIGAGKNQLFIFSGKI